MIKLEIETNCRLNLVLLLKTGSLLDRLPFEVCYDFANTKITLLQVAVGNCYSLLVVVGYLKPLINNAFW